MPMTNNGLSKLVEELGECAQVAGKLLQYPAYQENLRTGKPTWHPDGSDLRERMTEEMGDVLAAIHYVAVHLKIDANAIHERAQQKVTLFEKWFTEP